MILSVSMEISHLFKKKAKKLWVMIYDDKNGYLKEYQI